MNLPLVSIIVPTKNSAFFIERCLKSIKNQTYINIEIIVVDNDSSDCTLELANKYADRILKKGPERSVQRNFGVEKSKGQYVLIIDSDMELSKSVIKGCVKKAKKGFGAVIMPEESFGEGFWAQCKKLERSFYIGVDWMEAARFFDKKVFLGVGGFDNHLISGEDWDLSQRVKTRTQIGRVSDLIFHNEGRINLAKTLKKKIYYARHFDKYLSKNHAGPQISLIARYKLFLSRPKKLFKKPILGLGMLFMKTCEFGFGGLGLFVQRMSKGRSS